MLTLKAIYRNGKIKLLEPISIKGEHKVIVTFLEDDLDIPLWPDEKKEEVYRLLRGGGILTCREIEVLGLAQQGYRNKEIAEKLDLSDGSTRNHLSSIYSKLQVRNRTEALKKAVEMGIIDPVDGLFD